MYRKKNREKQEKEVKISLEALVPENHLLRAIDTAIDFSSIYEEVECLYSEKGRPDDKGVRRFASTDIFERIFKRILSEAEKSGYVDASAVFIDSTHIKASANKNKSKEVKKRK